MRPFADFAIGSVVSVTVFLLALGLTQVSGCGAAARLPALVECKLAALRVLPDDPMEATAYDAVDVILRLQDCHREAAGDGGSP
jgi:hypothetical protein